MKRHRAEKKMQLEKQKQKKLTSELEACHALDEEEGILRQNEI